MTDRRVMSGKVPHVRKEPRARNKSGAWRRKRKDTGKNRDSGGCFIATACYGYDSEIVRILRNWRDTSLLTNSFGRKFTEIYYKISPPIANFISEKPRLRRFIRITLYPIKKALGG